MFRNYFKTAYRSLRKNKSFTIINLLGLTLGLTSFLLITFYLVDELSYDRFNTKSDRIFRVDTDVKFGNTSSSRAIAAPVIANSLLSNFPEVENAIRMLPEEKLVKKGDEFFQEHRMAYSDPGIFDIFSLPMLEGDSKTALTEPNSVVLTETTAKKYFARTNVVGETISFFGDSAAYKITGVMRDIPRQSHFNFDFLLSMVSAKISYNKNFGALFPFSTYILVKQGADYKKLEAKFPGLLRKNLSYFDEMEKSGDYLKLSLMSLTKIHLQSNKTNELGVNGSLQSIYIFSAIALFIILIACINFMNLSTARFANRAREVGVRKVLGSPRKYLIAQFLSESVLVTFGAAVLALILALILIPLFNQLSGKDLSITMQTFTWLTPLLLFIIFFVGLLAGCYPAFFLSAFNPVFILKNKPAISFKKNSFRDFLVVFQFSISIFLIVGTLVIYKQLNYIQNKNVGFDRSQVLVVKNMNSLKNPQLIKQTIKQLPGVIETTLSSFLPTGNRRWINYVSGKTKGIETQYWPIDEDYLPTMGMTLVKGRNFSKEFSTDSSGIIINETAAKMLGYSDDPLNREIYFGQEKIYHILGVVKDFNFSSLRDNVSPVVMMMMTRFERKKQGDGPDNLCIRTRAGSLSGLLAQVENSWKAYSGNQPFEYSLMDEDFDAIYRSEQRTGNISSVFTALAILIACLGLFGLVAYAAEQRRKEISIRKILGASVLTIVRMLSANFSKLILIAMLCAMPLAWLIMNKWLQGFAYRINISWRLFLTAGCAAIVIAFITIGIQAVKAATVNPVNNLRNE